MPALFTYVFFNGCQNKQRIFSYAALTDVSYNRGGQCLLRGTK
jgi:ribosomal protein S27E